MVTRFRWLAAFLSLTFVMAAHATAQEPNRDAESIAARIQALNNELNALNEELESLERRQEANRRQAFFERADMQSAPQAEVIAVTEINERRELEQASNLNPFSITAHRTNYLLPLSYNTNPNRANFRAIDTDTPPDKAELKFQFSTKVGIANGLFLGHGDLYFGYTQRSWWQAYNTDASSPFRETNYEPELFIDFDNAWNIFGWVNARNRIALNHQSNGRSDPLSRSWNRVYIESIFQRDDWAIMLSPHWRIPETESKDDNPNIHHFMGNGDIRIAKRLNQDHEVTALLRGNPNHGNYGTQIDYSWPTFNNLRAHLQYYYGYGESLIDYDHRVHRLSIGFSLNPLFTPSGLNR
ncbi:phospholipase A [Halomonas vilamensis]|uniref:Phospholipase A1 n=1 Tax=Vreelandella vilamensis TaxID=531309 RepID=A0ABU1H2U0_9GAMM|nr:phospholipase A [Halomonas vilamensis]MDR5898620.1 phospholipase A [Halomonas vilamensis]